MKQIVIYFFTAAFSLYGSATVAIGDFENRTNRIYLDSWEQKIPAFLQSELSRREDIVVVDRHQLQSVLDEQALQMSGLIDSSNAQAVGQLLSAQYVITGTIHRDGAWFRIDAQVIHTGTGKVVGEKVQAKSTASFNTMIALLAANLSHQLTGQGVYQEKMTISSRYPTRYFLMGTAAGSIATVLFHQSYSDKRSRYQETVEISEFNRLYNSANDAYRIRNLVGTVTAGAGVAALVMWIASMNPQEVYASLPVMPVLLCCQNGGTSVGLQIRF